MSDLSLRQIINDPSLSIALRPSLPQLFWGMLAAVCAGLAMLAGLWGLIQIIVTLSGYWIIFSVICWTVAGILSGVSSWLSHHAESRFSSRLRRQVAQHIVRLPASKLSKQNDQSLKRLVSDDIASLHQMIAHLPSEVAVFFAIPLVSILILLFFVGPIALWVLLPGIIASLYYLVMVPYVSKRDGEARMQVMFNMIGSADNYARGIRDSRIYGQQNSALTDYTRSAQQFTQNMVMWVGKVATFASIAVALLQAVATFAIVYWVTYQHDLISVAVALFFSLAIVTPALKLGHGLDYVSAGRGAATRLSHFLQEPLLLSGDTKHLEETPRLEIVAGTRIIQNQILFKGLDYSFPTQAITAIVGPSGTGKTSLLRILAGLDILDQGDIYLSKINILDLDEEFRHKKILLIPQGVDALSTTVRENLKLSNHFASDTQLLRALSKAQLKVDLDTDATMLSGGEKQRIGLARAFLTEASIILLDEPTSALDQKVALNVLQQLKELAQTNDKTIIMVTHDLSLAVQADMTLSLEQIK